MSLASAFLSGKAILRQVTAKGRAATSSNSSISSSSSSALRSLNSRVLLSAQRSRSLSLAQPLATRALRKYGSPSRFNFGRKGSRQNDKETRPSEPIAVSLSESPQNNPLVWLGMAAVAATTTATSSRWWNWSWKPTSAEKLRSSEEKMLSTLNTPFELSNVLLENGEHINTLKMGQGPPLVMIHGFAGGLALFAANLEFLAQTHTVYAIDLPGFGRSSRPAFTGETTSEAEEYFVTRFEAWMDAVQLESAIIMGHSLGAYLSAAWAIRNPARFQRLLLVDPFGVGKRPSDEDEEEWRRKRRVRAFIIDTIKAVSNSPLTLLRAAGPFGPGLIKRLRPDLIEKFSHLHPGPSDAVSDYIYHINAQSPSSGEEAFSKLLSKTGIGWAAEPLIDRLPLLDTRVPVSFIYGEDSWMNPLSGVMLKESMPHHNTDFVVIPDAGHHVYIDQWQLFNEYALLSLQGRLDSFSKRQYAQLVSQLRAMAEEQAMQAQIKVSAQPSQIS